MIIEYSGMSGFWDIAKWVFAPVSSAAALLIEDEDIGKKTTEIALDVSEKDIIDTTQHVPTTTPPTIPDVEIQLPVTQQTIEKQLPQLPEVMPEMPQGMTLEEYMQYLRQLGDLVARRRELEREKQGEGFNLQTITEYLPFVGIGTGIFRAIWGSK